jgi:hypothetical protein
MLPNCDEQKNRQRTRHGQLNFEFSLNFF